MNNPKHQCPNCGHTLNIEVKSSRQPSSGPGHAPRQIMAMGGVSPLPAFKSHVKPIFSFQWEYLGMAAIVGAGATFLVSAVISSACYFAGQCFGTPFGGITALVITFAVSFMSALQFFDSGRYERKDEPTTAAAYASPMLVVKQEPQVIRVELKEKQSTTSTRYSWFDLPAGIDAELMRRVGVKLRANNWHYSRPLLCDSNTISQYKFGKLTRVLKERDMLVTNKQRSELKAAGRMLFMAFINPTS